MRQTVGVYDLGDLGPGAPAARPTRVPFPARLASRPRTWAWRPPASLCASLSLLVPGLGQLVRGQAALGLFFLTTVGFLAALSWAVIETLDRLAPTLGLLGIPLFVPFCVLGAAYALAAVLHTAGALGAASPGPGRSHAILAGLASVCIPGWGQLLNGDRSRAALFLGGVWVVAAVWIAGSPAATQLISAFAPAVPPWEQALRAPLVAWTARWTLPALIWSLSVYDAASSAGRR